MTDRRLDPGKWPVDEEGTMGQWSQLYEDAPTLAAAYVDLRDALNKIHAENRDGLLNDLVEAVHKSHAVLAKYEESR